MSPALLEAEGLLVRRGGRAVLTLDRVSLAPGERLTVFGPNGSGKSTLLEALAALLPLSSGRLTYRGEPVSGEAASRAYRRRTGVVLQSPLLLRGTVIENVAMPLRLRGEGKGAREARAHASLERLGVAHLADRSALELSGGEAQRVSIARALCHGPDLLFLDEPGASLDAPAREQMLSDLDALIEESGAAVVLVTHDIDEALALTRRALVLDGGERVAWGDLEALVRRPPSRRAAELFGAPNLLEVDLEAGEAGRVFARLAGAKLGPLTIPIPPGRATIALDPGELSLVSPGDALAGRALRVRRSRSGARVVVELEGGVRLSVDAKRAPALGEAVGVLVPAEALHVVDPG